MGHDIQHEKRHYIRKESLIKKIAEFHHYNQSATHDERTAFYLELLQGKKYCGYILQDSRGYYVITELDEMSLRDFIPDTWAWISENVFKDRAWDAYDTYQRLNIMIQLMGRVKEQYRSEFYRKFIKNFDPKRSYLDVA